MAVTRRDFLKYGAGGAALLGGGVMRPVPGRGAPPGSSVSRTTGRLRRGVPTTCLMCPARCGIVGSVEGARLVKIQGNPAHPNSRGRLCAKGEAGITLVRHPERVLQPMRRAGTRGGGRWQPISWEEAYGEVARRLRGLREAGQASRLLFQAGVESHAALLRRFLHAYGIPAPRYGALAGGANKKLALALTWGADFDVPDVAHARYVLNFGGNPFEAQDLVPLARRLVEGRLANRAKLVTFDPRLSQTAGRSDEWFPIRPGTDGMVALAMAHVILTEGLHDGGFLERWTNVPPAQLRHHLADYPPSLAERASGVPAADIRRIAREFATEKPATTLSGRGVSMHVNGTLNERCIFLLNTLVGNIDLPGGLCLPRTYHFAEPQPRPPVPAGSPTGHEEFFRAYRAGPVSLAGGGEQPPAVLITYLANPAYSRPDAATVLGLLQNELRVPYFVAMDSFLTESARMADLVLPVATYLEEWDLHSPPAYDLVPFVALSQPVVQPAGQSRPLEEILGALAAQIGGGMERFFAYGTAEDFLRAAIAPLGGLERAGGLDYLKARGVWVQEGARPDRGNFRSRGFPTASGKIEIASPALARRGFPALPVYEPIRAHQDLPPEDLILVFFKPNVQTGKTAPCKWLSEILHDNPVWIHPEAARARRIRHGDRVRLVTSLGAATTRAHLTEGIDPRVVAVAGGAGHTAYGRIAQAQAFRSEDPDTRLLWWERDGAGSNPNPIIPVQADPICGGQAWMDTVVRLARA